MVSKNCQIITLLAAGIGFLRVLGTPGNTDESKTGPLAGTVVEKNATILNRDVSLGSGEEKELELESRVTNNFDNICSINQPVSSCPKFNKIFLWQDNEQGRSSLFSFFVSSVLLSFSPERSRRENWKMERKEICSHAYCLALSSFEKCCEF